MSVTVASGKRGTYKATSAVDTFIINDDNVAMHCVKLYETENNYVEYFG